MKPAPFAPPPSRDQINRYWDEQFEELGFREKWSEATQLRNPKGQFAGTIGGPKGGGGAAGAAGDLTPLQAQAVSLGYRPAEDFQNLTTEQYIAKRQDAFGVATTTQVSIDGRNFVGVAPLPPPPEAPFSRVGKLQDNPRVEGKDLTAPRGSGSPMANIPKREYEGKVGDERLADVMHAQGFYSPGSVHTKEEMDAFVKAGEIEMYRGLSRERYAMDVINTAGSSQYTGRGFYGNGIYAAGALRTDEIPANYLKFGGANAKFGGTTFDAAVEALDIAGIGDAVRFTVDDGLDAPPPTDFRQGGVVRMTLKAGSRVATSEDIRQSFGSQQNFLMAKRAGDFDYGRYAALKGYDAIKIPKGSYADGSEVPPHYVILNRSALRIQNRPWKISDSLPEYQE